MKLRTLILSALFPAAAAFNAAAGFIDPMTQAMLSSYEELLNENPKDYVTYYDRAALYYKMSNYDEAITDINKALQYTPAKDKVMCSQEYCLLADIYIQLKEYDKALSAVDNALALTPEDYAAIYRKGNIYLYLNQPEDAYRTFAALQRMRSRSQEAYYGMAKANIMMGKDYEAATLIEQAENAAPNSAITYSRLGDIYMDMGKKEEAANSYLKGFLLADDASRPLIALVGLSGTDFPVVMKCIDDMLELTDNKLPLYFLKSNLAMQSQNYATAYEAYSQLLSTPGGQDAAVFGQMAKCSLALGKIEDAKEASQRALRAEPSVSNNVIEAMVQWVDGNHLAALKSASAAASEGSHEGMVLKSMSEISNGDFEAATNTLNEELLMAPDNVEALMLRAILKTKQGNEDGAKLDYNRLAHLPGEDEVGMFYQAYGLTGSGKKLDGDAVVAEMLEKYPTGRSAYLASIYYDKEGKKDEAERLRQLALSRGYYAEYEPALKPLWVK